MNKLILLIILTIPTLMFADFQTKIFYNKDQHLMIGLIIIANFIYAGMRAQNNTNKIWRIITFIFGLPFTIITYFVVKEDSERAFGIDLLKNKSNEDDIKPK